jgi:hypothetical protein
MRYLQHCTRSVNHMQKKTTRKNSLLPEQSGLDRETKILNVICNTTILLTSVMTEAITGIFTKLSTEMVTALATGLGAPEDTAKEAQGKTEDFQKELPKEMRAQVLAMKKDITMQLNEKKEKIVPLLADRRFDEGIAIVERYEFSLPKLTNNLDDRSLLGYIALLSQNNEQFTKMFQEILEWMKNLPQP